MNKSYSNKALPPGTVLREWRLEEVLGVGGFGIVYKGRGIYFDELVAIKEYFPSAISERKDGDTVVPIDSDSEEVHALGLKKFVEEAKLLWNLSTPTRHPNIVSVRSLFEIHGTAYMVMDFEDGMSLSKMIKQGTRFNEASLTNLIRPIAEGLERAHRVGVLHRDIKPPNILVNDDGRSVLIDFGSARFESGEATSTTVTFHTPPYAAIEQYVRTYEQGPWTDVYALGVVLHECITGEKPPEVLERMHGGLGRPLAAQEWPGYSRAFLKAVDAAMAIRPTERPRSISEWLALFSRPDDGDGPPDEPERDEDATRFMSFDRLAPEITPVAPPPPGFDKVEKVDTPVPEHVSEALFKRAGEDTNSGTKIAPDEVPVRPEPPVLEDPAPPVEPLEQGVPAETPVAAEPRSARKSGQSMRSGVIAGVAIVALAALAGGWYAATNVGTGTPGETSNVDAALADDSAGGGSEAAPDSKIEGLSSAVQALADDAREAGAPAGAVSALAGAAARLVELQSGLRSASGDPGQAEAEMAALAHTAATQFAKSLLGDAGRRAQRIARDLPWADPRSASSASGESADRQKIAAGLRQARAGLNAAALAAANAGDPGTALASGRGALGAWRGFAGAQARAYATARTPQAATEVESAPGDQAGAPSAASSAATAPTPAGSSGAVSPAKSQQLAGIVSSCRDVAASVINMGKISRPNSGASDDQKTNYRVLQQNTKSAQGYLTYLDNLTNSMRGAKNDGEADRLISQAEQTKRYLLVLLSRSTAASK